jgi:hypothetical protein
MKKTTTAVAQQHPMIAFVTLVGVLLTLLWGIRGASAAELYVPGEYPTIQDAVDVAGWSDVIVVTENVSGDVAVYSNLTDLKLRATDPFIVSTGNIWVSGGLLIRDITLMGGSIEVLPGAEKLFLGGVNLALGPYNFEAYDGDVTIEHCTISGWGPGILMTERAHLQMRWTEVVGMMWGVRVENTGSLEHQIIASLIDNAELDGFRVDAANLHLQQTTVVGNGRNALVAWNMQDNRIAVENSILTSESWSTTIDLNGEVDYVGVTGSVVYGDVYGLRGVNRFQVGRVSREDPFLYPDYHLTA